MKKILIIFLLLLSVGGFAQTLTPVLYPQYISGVGSGDVANDRKVPYACRMTLSGLIPNRLYYYYNRFVQDPNNTDPGIINGQGNIIVPNATAFQRITAPNLSAAVTAGTFTTDANGSYTGWFVTEPSASGIYFPGNQLYWRIMLRNDQFAPANAVELRLTATQPVTVLQWLNYNPYIVAPLTAPPGFVGTLLTRAANTEYTAKNFVMLFDNVSGSGRPIGGTFVEADGADESAANGYISAYSALNNTATRWGVAIPAGAPQGPGLANGIRNISQYTLANAALVNVCNGNGAGLFGAVNTANSAGTQATGAGLLNITTCGVALANCNNLSLSTAVTATNCNVSAGAVDLTVIGGTAPFTYSWSNGATTEDLSGVAGGTYTVTVTDGTGVCTAVTSVTVPSVSVITLSAAVSSVSACGTNNGSINLTVNGGVGPYTYTWSNGATTEDISGLAAGTYTVTVNGSGTCSATASYTVAQAPALVASASATPIPNCGGPTTTVTVNASGGTAPYTGTGNFSVIAGTYTYTITDASGCTASTTVTVAPGTCINVNEVLYPKYIQGVGSGSEFNDLRVPYACRMTITGLTGGATYRYFSRFTDNPASASNGAGAYILANQTGDFTRVTSASLSNAGSYGEFTTDGAGSYTGWFIVEPGSDIIYTPGNQLYWRLLLNDGAGGGTVASRITATNPVTVINWGTTSGSALEGSAIYNAPNAAFTPKNFVMLYDNIGGTGRPVSGTFIEADGTANTTAEFYDLFYELLVNEQPNVWGTIIPNNLANGINNISQYSLANGSFVNKCTSPDGVYGLTDTRNASKGNADPFTPDLMVIDCTPTAGCSLAGTTTVTNVLCFGASTGAVDLTITGGTAPTYLWSNGATTQDLTGVPAGTYTVTITDGTCTSTASATISQPASAVTTSAIATNVLCFGGSTGSVNLTVSGGTSPYTYLWSNGATTEDISGLAAGTYNVTVTDANGCTATASATITQPASAVTASATTTNVLCFGGSTGSVNLTVSGGASPYTYLWSNGATTEDISGLAAGTYSVTVTDGSGCIATASATVSQPASAVTASAVGTNVLCFGGSTGSVNLSVSGGTSPYSYAWSNGTATEDLANLAAGIYSVTVTDANGCTATATATISQPAVALSASSTAPPIAVVGGSTTITVSAAGGTAPYTGTGTFVRTAGTYSFTVTDANGCTASTTITLSEPNCNLTLGTSVINVACFGATTGSVNLTVTGATAPVTYSWSNGATTEDVSGLAAGTYSVTVTDASGCTATATVTVSQPAALLKASGVGTNVLCFGASTGSIDLTASGGAAPYTYLWSNGAVTEDLSGLAAGTYSVTVTDANACIATATVIVSQPASTVTASATAINVLCFGGSTGSVNLTVSGGTSPYTYVWSNGATTEDISGLAGGTYNVTVTDVNGCTATTGATISQPVSAVSALAAGTDVSCFGQSDGSVNLTVSGGTSPYTYVWSNGATTEDISGLAAGTYNVTVTDANGCTATASATVSQPAAALAAFSTAPPITVVGGSTTVTVGASGGTLPYTGIGTFVRTAGTYTFTVTDAKGCTASTTITLTEPGCNISISPIVVTNVACFGGSTGSIDLSVSGANGAVTYLWSNGATTEDLSGVPAGTYTVTVVDAAECSATATITVSQSSAIVATAVGTGLTCATTGNNGTIALTVSGGTAPYTYLWSNGATTQNLSSLAAGTYSVTVTDASGCTATASATIIARLAASSSVGPLACNAITGVVTVTATGGVPPYTGTGTFTLPFGAYSLVVTDAAGCSRTVTGRIAGPLVASASAGVIACGATTTTVTVSASQGIPPYSGTGSFTVGAGPYSFTVTDSRGCTAVISGVIAAPACYTVTEVYYPKYVQGVGSGSPADDVKVPYAARMTISGLTPGATYRYYSRFVDNPASLSSNGIGTYILVNQAGDFTRVTSASLSAAGSYAELTTDGTGSYTGWFVVEPGSDIAFTPGNQLYWRIVLNDGAGGSAAAARITATNPVTVLGFGSSPSQGTGLRRTASSDYTAKNFVMLYNNVAGTGRPEAGTFIESDGTVNSEANGFAAFYANSVDGVDKTWGTIIPNNLSNGINNISQYSLVDGSFVNACTSPDGVFGGTTDTKNASGGLTELVISSCNAPCNITLSTVVTNVACFGGSTGSIDLSVSGANGAVTYLWSNGATTEDLSGVPAGTYTVTVVDAAECSATVTVTVSQPVAALTATAMATAISCSGGSSTVTVAASGGTAPYTGTGTFSRTAGTYTFTVTDANGCTAVTTVTITQPAAVVATSTASVIACNGGSATVTVAASGGTAPYTGTGTFSRTAGTYTFTVTDANGCTAVTTITIAQPAVLTATATATPATSGSNGTATVTAAGGTAPYTYLWSPGGQTTATAIGLAAGTYTVTVTDARGCIATASATVTANGCNLIVNAGPDKVLCNGSITLAASVTGLSAGVPPATPFTEVAGSTADMRIFSGKINAITIGNTFSQSEDRNNCNKNTSSSKTLTIPAGAVIKKAYLYWSGSGSLDNTVKLNGVAVSADGTQSYTRSSSFRYFAARKDVTSMVTASGTYTVSDMSWVNGSPYCFDNSAYGAWAMTVVYEQASLPSARIHINTEKFQFTYPAGTYSTTINNVNVPAGCSANATLTIVAFEGDNYKGENLRIAGVLDADPNNFRGQAGPNLDIITKNAPSIAGGTTSLTYSIQSYQGNSIFGQAIEGLFDYVKVLKYNNCPPSTCNVTYLWKRNGTTVGTNQSISVSTAGTYEVTATDCAGCIATDQVVVTASTLAATATAPAIVCGGTTTTVTVSATGGTAPYTGTGTFSRGPGTYTFTVTDAAGCSRTASITIATPLTGQNPCTPAVLIASKRYNPSRFTNATVNLCSPATYTVPSYIQVTNGNAGNHWAELQYTTPSGQVITILYQGGSSQANPSGSTQINLGKRWSIYRGAYLNYNGNIPPNQTPTGLQPGQTFQAISVTLKVNGSSQFGTTEGTLTLTTQGCALTKGPQEDLIVKQPIEVATEMVVDVMPNPSTGYFNLIIRSDDETPSTVRIMDLNGRVISVHEKIGVNKPLRLGDTWINGAYFAEVIQGKQRKVVKLIKAY